jgi:hypothetical protein
VRIGDFITGTTQLDDAERFASTTTLFCEDDLDMGIFRSQAIEHQASALSRFDDLARRGAVGDMAPAAEVAEVLLASNNSLDKLDAKVEVYKARNRDGALSDDGIGTEEDLAEVAAKLGDIDDAYSSVVHAAETKRDKARAPLIAERDPLLSRQQAGVAARQRLVESSNNPAIESEGEQLSLRRQAVRGARSKIAGQVRSIRAFGRFPVTGLPGSVVLERKDKDGKAIPPAPPKLSASAITRIGELEKEDLTLVAEEEAINVRRGELLELMLVP